MWPNDGGIAAPDLFCPHLQCYQATLRAQFLTPTGTVSKPYSLINSTFGTLPEVSIRGHLEELRLDKRSILFLPLHYIPVRVPLKANFLCVNGLCFNLCTVIVPTRMHFIVRDVIQIQRGGWQLCQAMKYHWLYQLIHQILEQTPARAAWSKLSKGNYG